MKSPTHEAGDRHAGLNLCLLRGLGLTYFFLVPSDKSLGYFRSSAARTLFTRTLNVLLLGVTLTIFPALTTPAQTQPDKDYLVYVVSESADKIALIRFGPNGARVDHDLQTGDMPVDIDGPHGIVISPDRQFYYVSIAHGRPFGLIWKYATKDDSVLCKTTLGYFPATMDITPDGQFIFVVNFNLHGDMVPSSVSVVSTLTMTEVARIQT